MSNGEYCKTKNSVLYSSSSSVKFQATAVAHWLCALRRIPDGENQEILCALEVWSLESKDLHLGKIFNNPRFLHLPIYRKTLKELTWDCCAFWLAVSFSFLATYFFPAKDMCMYPDSSLASSEQFFRAIWESVSWAVVFQ